MKIRMVLVFVCLGSLIRATGAHGQQPAQPGGSPPFSRDRCPGRGTGIVDGIEADNIVDLIQSSEVVIQGTIVRVLPPEAFDARSPNIIHTTSLISVDEVLRGTPPASKTIAITELGGQIGSCSMAIKDSPLFEAREQYIFFLLLDPGTDMPNNSGAPRYATMGLYGGRAKIVDGKIHFSPSALPRVREYDNTDLAMFKDIVKRGVDVRKLRPDVPSELITPRVKP